MGLKVEMRPVVEWTDLPEKYGRAIANGMDNFGNDRCLMVFREWATNTKDYDSPSIEREAWAYVFEDVDPKYDWVFLHISW